MKTDIFPTTAIFVLSLMAYPVTSCNHQSCTYWYLYPPTDKTNPELEYLIQNWQDTEKHCDAEDNALDWLMPANGEATMAHCGTTKCKSNIYNFSKDGESMSVNPIYCDPIDCVDCKEYYQGMVEVGNSAHYYYYWQNNTVCKAVLYNGHPSEGRGHCSLCPSSPEDSPSTRNLRALTNTTQPGFKCSRGEEINPY